MKCAAAPDAEVHGGADAAPSEYARSRARAYFGVRRNLGRMRLGGVLSRLAETTARARLRDDPRSLAEVERGVADGVAEALRREAAPAPPARAQDAFAAFPLRLAADKRLRVCLFSRNIRRRATAAWPRTREVAVGLAARGHEATVISRALDGRPSLDFIEGVRVHRIDAAPIN